MRGKTTFLLLSIILIIFIFQSTGYGQGMDKKLAIFNDYVDKEWVGHYVGSEDSIYTHYISWTFEKKDKAVTEIKNVPELGYHQKTSYYWNWSENKLAFTSSNNKEIISSGIVHFENDKIHLIGKTYFSGGYSHFKKTFTIVSNDKVVDLFYRKRGDDWQQGHLIEYSCSGK